MADWRNSGTGGKIAPISDVELAEILNEEEDSIVGENFPS